MKISSKTNIYDSVTELMKLDLEDLIVTLGGGKPYPGDGIEITFNDELKTKDGVFTGLYYDCDDDDDCRGRIISALYEKSGEQIKFYRCSKETIELVKKACIISNNIRATY